MDENRIGFFRLKNKPVIINEGRKHSKVTVKNEGEHTIQVGSHFHFFEVNKKLVFDREQAFGMHLDIPSGTSVRFLPGEILTVDLTEYRGRQFLIGFSGMTNGCVNDVNVKNNALNKARERGIIKEDDHEQRTEQA